MNNFKSYMLMKEETSKLETSEEIHNFIEKYKYMPMGMVRELQEKLNVINEDNKLNNIGIVHVIDTYDIE